MLRIQLRWSRVGRVCLILILGVAIAAMVMPAWAAPAKKAKKKKPPRPALPVQEGAVPQVKVVGVDPALRSSAAVSARMIDRLIAADLARNKIQPNKLATDQQFVRRAYLTLTGAIPVAAQAESFCRKSAEDKYQVLVDQLLGTPAHASHLYNQWADTLRLMDVVPEDNQMKPYQEWVKESLRDNMPYDEFVHEMLTASGHVWDNPAVGYTLRDSGMPLDSLNNTVRVFLGTQIGCAQCHDHPFDRWTQKEFYQLAAFVSGNDYRKMSNADLPQMMSQRTPKKMPAGGWFYEEINFDSPEARLARVLYRSNRYNFVENPKGQLRFPKDYNYSNAKPNDLVSPAVIFGKMPDLGNKSRREAFADWLTSRDNPRFTRTIANRTWKQIFGRGLIEPVDDMRDDTVASNPELMTFLEEELKRLDYNMREFIRVLSYTDAFRRQVTYDDLQADAHYHFQGPVLRRMTAEQVWDSLLILTVEKPQYTFEFTEEFEKAIDLTEAKTPKEILEQVEKYRAYQKLVNDGKKKVQYKGQELLPASELRQPLPDSHFLRQFGQSRRDQIDDSTLDGTVPQLLVMFNGFVTHMMLENGSVVYKRIVSRKSPKDQIDAMFWCLLSREPTGEERALAMAEMEKHGAAGYGNVIWALLNTREFLFVQ